MGVLLRVVARAKRFGFEYVLQYMVQKYPKLGVCVAELLNGLCHYRCFTAYVAYAFGCKHLGQLYDRVGLGYLISQITKRTLHFYFMTHKR